MLFICGQVRYDTSEMLQYETRDPWVPLIYALRDFSGVFVVTFEDGRGVDVHRAAPEEIRTLAKQYALPELLRAADPPPAHS